MKNRWWAVPLLMLISAWLCAAIRELLVLKSQLSKSFSDVLLPIACLRQWALSSALFVPNRQSEPVPWLCWDSA